MTEPTRASSSPRHRGVVLVTGQSPSEVDLVADRLAGSTSRRVDSGPDVHDAADAGHRLALDLAHDRQPIDVVVTLAAGTPSRATGLLLGSLLDSSLGRPDGRSLLQHVVSVVSAVDLADLVLGGVDDRFLAAEHVVDLVEYATVIVLVDTAAVRPRDLRTIRRLLARLAPESRVASVAAVRRETLESPGGAAQLGGAAGWMQALSEHTPDLDHDGVVTTYVYRDERPFHPGRLALAVEHTFAPGAVGTLLRSRGFTQFATRCDRVGSWSSVGQMLSLDPTSSPSWHPDSPHGQQIAFFGLDLDVATIRRELDACLLTDDELLGDPAGWRDFVDPFPVWSGPGAGPGHRH